MEPRYDDGICTVYLGDCRDVLPELLDASVDAVVTDPPYDLTAGKKGGSGAASVNLDSPYGRSRIGTGNGGFMGKDWDATGVAFEPATWRHVLRVLKPGGHLLAFGGTRTYHRLAIAIEDAGFEIRDCIAWLYGSGFPKSVDVSKGIDKARRRDFVLAAVDLGLVVPGNNLHDWTKADHSPGDKWWERFKEHLSPEEWQSIEREVVARGHRKNDRDATSLQMGRKSDDFDITTPATDEAARWEGWGTALKPAHEPIIVARKPLVGTVAANVQAHGTGALNIDGCRVATDEPIVTFDRVAGDRSREDYRTGTGVNRRAEESIGRWPANVVLDEEAADELDRQTGVLISGANPTRRSSDRGAESGGASRFYPVFRYEAKAGDDERPRVGSVAHPTVKPVALMRWLVRLVTPPEGVVLDPFLGSGTTAEACVGEGLRCIGIEREEDYMALIEARLGKGIQIGLAL